MAPPELEWMISEEFGTIDITIIVEWSQIGNDVWYSVSTEPPVDVNFLGNTSVQLVVFYNTLYNVTIVAHSLCNSTKTTVGFTYSEFNLWLVFLQLNVAIQFQRMPQDH